MRNERTFDWKGRSDERSLQFGIKEATPEPKLHNRSWSVPNPLDQGEEGACVGHGWVHEALSSPVVVDIARMAQRPVSDPQALAFWLYREAQKIDEWEGEQYDGTSVLAGAKVMQKLGLLRQYRWAFDVFGVRRALLTTGPVVVGLNWYSGMYSAPGGILSVRGYKVGGHCGIFWGYRLPGLIFPDEAAYGFLNSWGPHWGVNGRAWMRESELARLMSEDGEACVPYRRSYGR